MFFPHKPEFDVSFIHEVYIAGQLLIQAGLQSVPVASISVELKPSAFRINFLVPNAGTSDLFSIISSVNKSEKRLSSIIITLII